MMVGQPGEEETDESTKMYLSLDSNWQPNQPDADSTAAWPMQHFPFLLEGPILGKGFTFIVYMYPTMYNVTREWGKFKFCARLYILTISRLLGQWTLPY